MFGWVIGCQNLHTFVFATLTPPSYDVLTVFQVLLTTPTHFNLPTTLWHVRLGHRVSKPPYVRVRNPYPPILRRTNCVSGATNYSNPFQLGYDVVACSVGSSGVQTFYVRVRNTYPPSYELLQPISTCPRRCGLFGWVIGCPNLLRSCSQPLPPLLRRTSCVSGATNYSNISTSVRLGFGCSYHPTFVFATHTPPPTTY